MSLKAVHLVFVGCVILLALAVGTHSFLGYRQDGGVGSLLAALAWWLVGVGMLGYGRRVVRKLRNLRSL